MLKGQRQLGTVAGLVGLSLVLWILTPYFLTVSNLLNIAQQTSVNAIIAVGMTFVIITAGIDLSVGSVLAFSGIVMASLLEAGVPLPLAVLAGPAVGAGCGAVNGVLISHGRLPPFIATLGMMSVARGLALISSGGRPVSGFEQSFRVLATGELLFLPVPVWIMAATYLVAHLALTRTRFGRYVYAIGATRKQPRSRASTSPFTSRWCTSCAAPSAGWPPWC